MVPQHDKLRSELMRLIPLVAVEGRRIVQAFADRLNLHETDVEALSHVMLAEAERTLVTAGKLGNELGLTSGATTFLIRRLEQAGLVERARDADDQRKVIVQLTGAGRALVGTIYPPVAHLSNAVMDGFSPSELDIIHCYLTKTAAAMATYRISLSSAQPDPT